MKESLLSRFLIVICLVLTHGYTNAQCGGGTTRDTLNWDTQTFLPNIGKYVTPTAWITLAQSQTQKFAYGTQMVTVTHNYSGANDPGDNGLHTAKTSSYSNAGKDVQFIGNGAVTFTFQASVQSVKFSVYDIDKSQTVKVTALNSIGVAQTVVLTKLAGSILTIAGIPTAPTAVATVATVANTANTPAANGTLNVDIAGPITSFTITVTTTGTLAGTEDGSYFISDISACSSGTFPATYWMASKPYTNMPGYVLVVRDNIIYYVDPSNGKGQLLFTESGGNHINSCAYDPVRHFVYFTYTLTGAGGSLNQNDKTLRRYDYNLDTVGVVTADVHATLGIPTFEEGVESAAGCFFNGSLYLGCEGTDGGQTSGRKSILWKIDFNASYVPTTVSQAYATPADDGAGTMLHDWGDVGINNGILYDFDATAAGGYFYHKDLLTGNLSGFSPSPSTINPRQTGIDYNGNIYNVGGANSSSSGSIVKYNLNGTVNTGPTITIDGVTPTGNWGDAGEAFLPKTDFGDAPATYDPAGSDPATTEEDDSLHLGVSRPGVEWVKKTSSDATGDGAEEDGITGSMVVGRGTITFVPTIKVYNHTGSNATLVGWFDYNGDGVFQASEGRSVTVPSSASLQTINLPWTAINNTVPLNRYTFLRLRLTSASNGMTTSNPTGYLANGEVEDYEVYVTTTLPINNIELIAQKKGNTSLLVWKINDQTGYNEYVLERSTDRINWQTLSTEPASGTNTSGTFMFNDSKPGNIAVYYRVKGIVNTGEFKYSEIKGIYFQSPSSLTVLPNPVRNNASFRLECNNPGLAIMDILDFSGRKVYQQNLSLQKGKNEWTVNTLQKLNNGLYMIRIQINNEILTTTLVIAK